MEVTPTDGIDLSTAILHGTLDPTQARITASLDAVEFATDKDRAVRPVHTPNPLRWPDDHIPEGWTGPIQFTLWAFVKIGDVWHGGALQEFWKDRGWCGANWLLIAPEGANAGKNNWQANWAYDHGRWGAMCDYVPHEGDEVGFMLLAGDSRPHVKMATVAERTNTIRVLLRLQGVATPIDQGPEPPEPIEPPEPEPPDPDHDEMMAALARLEKQVAEIAEQLERGFSGTTSGVIQMPAYLGGARPFTLTQTLKPVPE